MRNPVVRKLQHGAVLSAEDQRALTDACGDIRAFGPRTDLIVEGDRPDHVHAMIEGFACRYKLLDDGGRQILAWLTPGDCCDLQVSLLNEMDHSIATLSECTIGYISRADVEALLAQSAEITRAMWWASLVDEAVLREWLAGMGRRSAEKQVAHIFCELLERLKAVGLADGDQFDFPVTQVELADTVGLSSVHVNRITQGLRDRGLIRWRGTSFAVLDVAALRREPRQPPQYLHLDRGSRFDDAPAKAPAPLRAL